MKCTIISLLAATSAVVALPHPRAMEPQVDDTTILNFALTLEHLEDAFYSGALKKFDEAAFANAGYAPWVRERFTQIAGHEATHVATLSKVLGDKAVQQCEYSFPYTDPKSFAALSQIFEGVGTGAYTGASKFIQNKAYLGTAAEILATEARQASWVASAVNKQNPWSTAFETPLSFDQAFSLAMPFIKSCPSTNAKLPFQAFPTLTFPMNTKPGQTVPVKVPESVKMDGQVFVAFLDGMNTEFAPVSKDGMVQIPENLMGTVYAVLTKSNDAVADSGTLAGPALLDFAF